MLDNMLESASDGNLSVMMGGKQESWGNPLLHLDSKNTRNRYRSPITEIAKDRYNSAEKLGTTTILLASDMMRSESPTTMGLTSRESSSNSVILTSSSSIKNNKKSSSNQREDKLCAQNPSIRLHIHELNPICKSRKKAEEDDEDGDFDKQFGEEGSFDGDKYMWLSSGTMSPPSCFDDQRFSVLLDLSPDDQWLVVPVPNSSPLLGKDTIFFDGSKVNPIEEASLVLERTSLDAEKIFHEDLKEDEEEEIVSWLSSSISNERTDWERNGFGVSYYAEWISDTESEFDYLGSEVLSSNSSSVSSFSEILIQEKSQSFSFDYVSEDVDLTTGAADEPLFWPSDRKFNWGSELKWDFFIMSPRKHKHKDKTLEGKLTFVGRMQTKPSRLGESRKFFAKIVPLDVVEPTSDDVLNEKSNLVDKDFESNEEVAIETLLGLDEFDGHEGIESEFNKDDFCLDESV
ncbi:hypothetical protein LOK49_LG08G02064 [Camellia lanceoleosa]|uniref:Uncharacterized protein n=1 Tax=Camellia lanceoleosa TaxID=1840588 RepID=A0ACC0GUL9_9ERIC|nr:hypothetical protein LOK49_LG08G02064 [Camellia lanceoleosa]